jgi:uncharacterized membrane protein
MISIVASAILLVFGIYLGLTKEASEAATLGWILAFVGGASLAVNLVLRTWMR